MFFVVSKLFWLVAQPISIVLLLIVLGSLLVAFGRRRLALAVLVLAIGVLGLASLTNFGAVIIRPLEERFAVPVLPERVDAIVMLGGATVSRISGARQTVAMTDAGERLSTTLWLALRFPQARIVLSGGGGLLSAEGESEAETARRFFVGLGIDEERLVLEGQSRNTIENARFTQSLLAETGGTTVLVTSAFHIPRSVGLFRAEAVSVLPWPTDFRSTGKESFGFDLADLGRNLDTTSTAMREWIGLTVYWATGQIETWFPAP
ncbi:MAG: YdcF family protein [Devosia marina]|jgi:uncharacterized SAM-binding protein YcdF (DUF218 family)|uniref:YdcF family protein n=1 Tax=Devosia marina TaxID=2683198 RepID=UPI000D5E22A8